MGGGVVVRVWGWVAAAGVAAVVGTTGYRITVLRRALVAERAVRRVEGAAAARELAAVEVDVAAFGARVRVEIAALVARERVLAEAGAVVDRAWDRHRQERDGWMEGGSDA